MTEPRNMSRLIGLSTIAVVGVLALVAAGLLFFDSGKKTSSSLSPATESSSAPATRGSLSAGSSTSSAAASGPQRTTAELQAILLTINDLGQSGWAVDTDQSNSDSDSSCGTSLDDPAHQASITFSQGGFGPFLEDKVLSTGSSVKAQAEFAAEVANVQKCATSPASDGTTYTATDESFPKLGDDTHAWRVKESAPASSSDSAGANLASAATIDVIVVRDGQLIHLFAYIAIFGSSSSDLPTIAKTAVARAHPFS